MNVFLFYSPNNDHDTNWNTLFKVALSIFDYISLYGSMVNNVQYYNIDSVNGTGCTGLPNEVRSMQWVFSERCLCVVNS
jgi:hypothetical protein